MLPSEGTEDDLAKQDFPNLKVKFYNTLCLKKNTQDTWFLSEL